VALSSALSAIIISKSTLSFLFHRRKNEVKRMREDECIQHCELVSIFRFGEVKETKQITLIKNTKNRTRFSISRERERERERERVSSMMMAAVV
jgi:hypothetical protein